MDTEKIIKGKTKLIAHRGLSGIETENTAAAFVAAGNRDYYGIETDVHKTADGKFIIIHDDTTGRVARKNLSVEKSDFSALRSLRLPDKEGKPRQDLCLPSLEEYLRICRTYGKECVLELKNPFEKDDIKAILKTVKNEYASEHTIFISFDYGNLVTLRGLDKKAVIQYLYSDSVDDKLIEKLKKYNFGLDIHYGRLTEKNIALLHESGTAVNCWTVDDKKTAEKLAGWGVDYITTNILE